MDTSKWDRYINKPITFKIGETEFKIGAVPCEHLGEFFELSKLLEGITTMENVLLKFNKDSFNSLIRMVVACLKVANPEIPEDKIKQFVSSNLNEVMLSFIEANMVPKTARASAQKRLKELREKRKDAPDSRTSDTVSKEAETNKG